MNRFFSALRALVYAAAFVVFWGWIAVSVRPLDARHGFAPPAWLVPIGFVFVMLGSLLGLISIGAFLLYGRGTPAPFDPPREFVAAGPYRFVRNPMYVGGVLILFGTAMSLQSITVGALAILFFGAAHLFVTQYEEPRLARQFGSSYASYRERVNRWIPRIPERWKE